MLNTTGLCSAVSLSCAKVIKTNLPNESKISLCVISLLLKEELQVMVPGKCTKWLKWSMAASVVLWPFAELRFVSQRHTSLLCVSVSRGKSLGEIELLLSLSIAHSHPLPVSLATCQVCFKVEIR